MKNFITNFLKDESGASAAEYALILAIVGAGIAAASIGLGEAITGAMNQASALIENPSGTGTTPAPDTPPE